MRMCIGVKAHLRHGDTDAYNAPVTPLALRLRPYRERKGWSQAELGRRSGVSQATISRIEAGNTNRVDLATVDRLAKALGVSPKSLLVSK